MKHLRNVARLGRTVRHLRPVQVYGRLWFSLARPHPDLLAAPTLRKQEGIWQVPVRRARSLVAPGRFCFLNEAGSLAELGWDDPAKAKLWRYNQHYFDDLNAESANERLEWHKELIIEWISANSPGQGSGWEPYPTSLRIVNWIKWALAGNALHEEAIASLAVQTRWLTRRMEWHLLGNHLFANAKALVFAGLFFEGSEGNAWLHQGLRILAREMDEQILPDGGQFELSPMYHVLAVEDVLDLVNIAHAYGREDLAQVWRVKIPVMLSWLETMSHPDGGISFFNDAAFGIAPTNSEIFAYSGWLGIEPSTVPAPVRHLANSGYLRAGFGPYTLIADLARVGPDYLPGHAHADTLSFELSVGNQRVFVNSGTSEYGTGPERHRQRGTPAHNTVVVNGENSSEVWSGFRVGRRARPLGVSLEQQGPVFCAQASHDGYRYLKGHPRVTRRFEIDGARLTVLDFVSPKYPAQARYHLHPSVEVECLNSGTVVLRLPDGQSLKIHCKGGDVQVEPSTWHPEFGLSIPNLCLVLPLADGEASLSIVTL